MTVGEPWVVTPTTNSKYMVSLMPYRTVFYNNNLNGRYLNPAEMNGKCGISMYGSAVSVIVDDLQVSDEYAGVAIQALAVSGSGDTVNQPIWWCRVENIAVTNTYDGILMSSQDIATPLGSLMGTQVRSSSLNQLRYGTRLSSTTAGMTKMNAIEGLYIAGDGTAGDIAMDFGSGVVDTIVRNNTITNYTYAYKIPASGLQAMYSNTISATTHYSEDAVDYIAPPAWIHATPSMFDSSDVGTNTIYVYNYGSDTINWTNSCSSSDITILTATGTSVSNSVGSFDFVIEATNASAAIFVYSGTQTNIVTITDQY